MIRKSNNQLIKRTDQKLKDLLQMAGHPVRHQAQRLPTVKNPQKQQRRPVGQRTPPAEEEESRVSGGLKMLVTSGHQSVGLNTGTVFMTWGFPLDSGRQVSALLPGRLAHSESLRRSLILCPVSRPAWCLPSPQHWFIIFTLRHARPSSWDPC